MRPIRDQYLSAAERVIDQLDSPAVARAWTDESALSGFTVGGLAAHIAAQITSVDAALDADDAGKEVIGLFEHFERAAWVGTGIDNDANTAIRAGGEDSAEAGPAAVLAEAAAALQAIGQRLPDLGAGAVGGNPRWPYATSFDDFLITRIMEIVVHTDDLDVSVQRTSPEFDADVFDTATWVLTRLAAARHGQVALVRALARSERAPATISGL